MDDDYTRQQINRHYRISLGIGVVMMIVAIIIAVVVATWGYDGKAEQHSLSQWHQETAHVIKIKALLPPTTVTNSDGYPTLGNNSIVDIAYHDWSGRLRTMHEGGWPATVQIGDSQRIFVNRHGTAIAQATNPNLVIWESVTANNIMDAILIGILGIFGSLVALALVFFLMRSNQLPYWHERRFFNRATARQMRLARMERVRNPRRLSNDDLVAEFKRELAELPSYHPTS